MLRASAAERRPASLPPLMSELDAVFQGIPENIQKALHDLGWTKAMPVQAATIPLMREGRDLIVQAHTGSGKTGAFGIPIIEAIDTSLPQVQALVMAPTRELALQVQQEVETLGSHAGVRVLAVYGGVGYAAQLEGLEEGAHVVVGTPGRILDHLSNGRMDVDHLKTLVFDEADEMLSLGFWPDMREIESYLPKQRRSYLFSATIPEKVRSLSRFFLNDPEFVAMDQETDSPQQIEHVFYMCQASEKEKLLARILEYEDPESAIIFCNTKADVRYVTSYLQRRGFQADQISGDLQQAAREKALAKIKAGDLKFLVATDVAARGIDISDLSHVISYAASDSAETYVHRTGRTGRAGKSGTAISLVSGLDIGNFKSMQHVNKISMTERKAPAEKDMRNRLRERLTVKVEQEMRHAPEDELKVQIDRLIPIVEEMAETREGRRDLAGIAAAYLHDHRPETTITEDAPKKKAKKPIGAEAAAEAEERAGGQSQSDDGASHSGGDGDRPRKRRRRGGRSRGGGNRRDGGRAPSSSRGGDRS